MVEALLVFCEIVSVKRITAGSIACTSLEFRQDRTSRSLAPSYMKKEHCTFCANFLPYSLNLLLSLGDWILAVLQGYPMKYSVLFVLH